MTNIGGMLPLGTAFRAPMLELLEHNRQAQRDLIECRHTLEGSCAYYAALRATEPNTREPLAALCQSARFAVPRTWHAVDRNRALAAAALGHAEPPGLDYGLGAVAPSLGFVSPCVTLLTATSRDDKLWAEAHWIALGCHLAARGLTCLLPAGSAVERARAARIAAAIPQAQALPPSDLTTLAGVLAGSRFVVGVDTGLVHLAAALERPVVALFCASEPGLTGVLAARDAINLGARGAPPSPADVIAATDGFAA